MKVIGLMSFYDEEPEWLAAAVTSFARCGITHFVAVDGAYFLYPQGTAWSGTEQHRAIIEACNANDAGLTLHVPTDRWTGNEVEKRDFLFRAGELAAEPGDWYCVIDADEVATRTVNLPRVLPDVTEDVAEVMFWERRSMVDIEHKAARGFPYPRKTEYPIRILFRAIPGLAIKGNHYTVITPDDRRLWGNAADADLEPAHNLTELRVEHRTSHRIKCRHDEQAAYYKLRDRLGVEAAVPA